MILDACTFVGDWPFAADTGGTVDDLLRRLDRAGLERALVSPLAGAFHQDPRPANRRLAAELAAYADRLLLCAACNPLWPDWRDCVHELGELGSRAVRLFPNYHGYTLAEPAAGELAAAVTGQGLPLVVTMRLQDERHHPPAFMTPAVPHPEVVALAQSCPAGRFVMSMGRYGEVAEALAGAPNLWADVAGVQGPTRGVGKLAAAVGADRLLFGSELLLQYAEPAVLKLRHSRLAAAEQAAIMGGNAQGLLAPL